MSPKLYLFLAVAIVVLGCCLAQNCEQSTTEVTIKSYSNIDDTKAVFKDVKPENYNSELSGFAKVIFLYGQVPVLCLGSFELDSLEVLQMNYMGLEFIEPGAFGTLPSLRVMNLKANNLTEIDDGIFNGLPIKFLLLTSNKIRWIHSNAFDNLDHLVLVNLEDNQLEKYDAGWFKHSKAIRHLSLENNNLRHIQKHAFIQLNSSAENPFKMILSYNKIEAIEGQAFESLQYIDSLDLTHNRLNSVPYNLFYNVMIVKNLLLNWNSMTLTPNDLDTFRNVENLNAGGTNKIHCFFVRGFLNAEGKNFTMKNKCDSGNVNQRFF